MFIEILLHMHYFLIFIPALYRKIIIQERLGRIFQKKNEDLKKPQPKTCEDFSEDEIPDFSEIEISTN